MLRGSRIASRCVTGPLPGSSAVSLPIKGVYIRTYKTSLNVKNSKASKEATKQSSGEPSKKDIKQPAGKASKESVQKNSTETVKKHSQESPNEAGESAGTRKKGFGRFAKVVLAVTMLSTTAYGGAVYYSLRDDKFRRHFTSSIPGADRAVGYVETLDKEGNWNKLSNDVVRYSREKYNDFVSKITGQSSPVIKKDTNEDRMPAPQTVQKVSATEPIIEHLSRIINELADILSNEGLSEAGSQIISKAREELNTLDEDIKRIKNDGQTLLKRQLNDQTEKFNKLLESNEKAMSDYIQDMEIRIKDQYEKEKIQIQSEAQKVLTTELSQQAVKHMERLKDELVRQAAELQRRWIRSVRAQVEKERGGRLARLDYITLRLKTLERLAMDNVEHLDHSLKGHKLWVAVYALQQTVMQPRRTPFINELYTLKKVAGDDELINVVVGSIDETAALHGICSLSDLRNRFKVVREEIRRASLVPENGGVFAHALSLLLSKFMFRKNGLVPGNDVEAILGRVGYYLGEGDLDSAARELNQLTGWSKVLANDWIAAARSHLEVKQALQVIETQATLSSLSVV